MSTYNYSAKLPTVAKLLTKYGQKLSIINSNKSQLSSGNGIQGSLSEENLPATLTENVDAVYYIEPSFSAVSNTNFLKVNNAIYKIVAVEIVQPAEVVLLYKVFVSK